MKKEHRGNPTSGVVLAVILLASTAGYVSALTRIFQSPLHLSLAESNFQFDNVAAESRTAPAPANAEFQQSTRTAPAWLTNALPSYSSGRNRQLWYSALQSSVDRDSTSMAWMSSDVQLAPSPYRSFGTNFGTVSFVSAGGDGLFAPLAPTAQKTWNNTGTDFNAGASWTGGVAPGSGDVGLFNSAPVTQPNVTSSITIAGLLFSVGSSGYDITSSSASTILTLNGTNTTGSGGSTTSTAAAIRNDNTSGTTTIDAPLALASTSGISTFFQDVNDGSTLILNGVISESGGVRALSLKNGTFQLNNANTYTGGTSIDAPGTTVVIGNDSALGTGTFTINNSATLQAGGGARTLANNIVLGGDTLLNGNNAFTFNGTLTSQGSASRTLTVSNTGGLVINGNVFLAPDNTTARGLTISGSSDTTINGVIANNNAGNTLASTLTKSGAGTLILTGTNTYTGTTTVNGGTLLVNGNDAAATGNVIVNNAGTFLGGTGTIGGATTINGNASITGGTNGTVGTLTLASLTFNGTTGNLATYVVDISGAMSDLLTMGGSLNLTNSFDQITFNGTPDGTSSYLLAHADGGIAGTFNFGAAPANYMFVYGSNDLTLVPIPEMSTWIGAALALGAIGFMQRRKLRGLIASRA